MEGVIRRNYLGSASLVLLCAALSLAGSVVALRAASPVVRSFVLGSVAVSVAPALDPRVDVYVPVVDWGVRARPFRAPLAVELQFRSLDRKTALDALESGRTPDANLDLVRRDLRATAAGVLRRAGLVAVAGGVLAGFLAGALLASVGRRRVWLARGAVTGAVSSLLAVALCTASLARVDSRAFHEVTFYANGNELPRLLAVSNELLEAGEAYSDAYDRAVAGLTRLVATGGSRAAPARTSALFVASDLHSNELVLPGLARYTAGHPVFLVGDFTQRGTRLEERVVPQIAALGRPVIAVSGNHDSRPFMRALARAGVVVLTRSDPLFELDGLTVAGYDDPLEAHKGTFAARRLELREGQVGGERRRLLAWFADLPERPDVVLVHQHGLAHALLDALGDDESAPPLLILTGHDHRQHLERRGSVTLVDGGTVGAGGAFAVGDQASGFVQLHLTVGHRLQAADLIEIEPLSGAARARRVVFDAADAAPGLEEAAR
jgi:predicted phosphodiesterase